LKALAVALKASEQLHWTYMTVNHSALLPNVTVNFNIICFVHDPFNTARTRR